MIAVVLDLVWMGRCDKQTAAMMHPFVIPDTTPVVKSLDVSVAVAASWTQRMDAVM
jgi:hypothetical protein